MDDHHQAKNQQADVRARQSLFSFSKKVFLIILSQFLLFRHENWVKFGIKLGKLPVTSFFFFFYLFFEKRKTKKKRKTKEKREKREKKNMALLQDQNFEFNSK